MCTGVRSLISLPSLMFDCQHEAMKLCSVGLLVLDVRRDPCEEMSNRLFVWASLARVYGITSIIVCINQLDYKLPAVASRPAQPAWSEQHFVALADLARRVLLRARFTESQILGVVPTSCRERDSINIGTNNCLSVMPWYLGPGVVEILESVEDLVRFITF